jgi:hypothetical protein
MSYSDAGPPPRKHWLLSLGLALAVGFLGANRFADAAGFPREGARDWATTSRVLSGFVVGLLTFAVVQFLLYQTRAAVNALARSPRRPGTAGAVALLACGMLCFVGVIALEWHLTTSGATASQAVDLRPFGGGSAQVSVGNNQPPLMGHIVAVFVFMAGAALTALGVWGTMQPAGPPTVAQVRPSQEPHQAGIVERPGL